MTVDSGGGGLAGGGGGPLVEEEGPKKEICARLINYQTAYNSQAWFGSVAGQQHQHHQQQQQQQQQQQHQHHQETSAPQDDFPIIDDDPENMSTLWPDDPDSGHPFTKAALQGDLATVKEHVARQTFDPGSKKAQHALLVACRTGNVEMTKVLLDAGVDVHCKDAKSGWRPIHIATYRDHVAVVEALAMHGEWRRGVALVRFRGITCNLLHLAANFGCLAVLRYLLSHTVRLGLHLEVRDAAHWTALHHAAFEGRTQAVTLLLQAGADINTADPHGVTPLHAAAYNDHVPIVRFLLSRGANPKMIVKAPTSATPGSGKRRRASHAILPTTPAGTPRGSNLGLSGVSAVGGGLGTRTSSLDNLFRRGQKWSPNQAPRGSLTTLFDPHRRTLTPPPQPVRVKWVRERVSSPPTLTLTPPTLTHAVSQEWPGRCGGDVRTSVTSRSLPSSYSHGRVRKTSHLALGTERGLERVEPILKFHVGSTLLHWAAYKSYDDLVADLLARGLSVDAGDRLGRTPLGLATWAGHTSIVNTLLQENSSLSEEDKDWRGISREEVGLCIVRVIEETAVCSLNAARSDGFTLLHLAAQQGYPNMMHRLLSLKVSPDVRNNQGETPLFVAIRNNQLACVQQLINAGTRLSLVDNRGGSALHMAAKNGNVTVIDMLLTTSELEEERNVDINLCDKIGYTPIYYATNASRYDIVQRFLEYSLVRKVHCKATNGETLLQFYTERNNLGQYDNAVVRVLECEKLLHSTKPSAEMCLRVQLGTTEASSKARSQLQAMYESTRAQRHCWNFWFFLSCFLLPSVFYYLDVYTDILLAVEYHQDYLKSINDSSVMPTNATGVNHTYSEELVMEMEEEEDEGFLANLTDNPDKINFLLTVFFILLPAILLSTWNLYIHVTQQDILPIFKLLPSFLRVSLYTLIFLTPLAPVMAYLENTYAQMKHMNVTARQMQEVGVDSRERSNPPVGISRDQTNPQLPPPQSKVDSKSYNSFPPHGATKTYIHHMRDMEIRKYYDLKHVAQMRVAITNVMEATLESAFQLILQLYIVGTHYTELDQVKDVTLGSILSLSGKNTQLSKQVFSVLISLVSLTWSFTSYHRFSKLGGLTILNALPLLFAIFFQVVSRAIACTVFTLAHTWKVFVVLGVHFVVVLVFKLKLEESSVLPVRTAFNYCQCFIVYLRPYFYVFLGTIASTLVYFRLERPSAVKKQRSRRHSTVVIQVLFLVLAFIENLVLLALGICGLDKDKYDNTFIIISAVLCAISYLTGVILHSVYYSCFGHPWVDINGPSMHRDTDEGTLVLSYYQQGRVSKWAINSCCNIEHHTEMPTDLVPGFIMGKEVTSSRDVDGDNL